MIVNSNQHNYQYEYARIESMETFDDSLFGEDCIFPGLELPPSPPSMTLLAEKINFLDLPSTLWGEVVKMLHCPDVVRFDVAMDKMRDKVLGKNAIESIPSNLNQRTEWTSTEIDAEWFFSKLSPDNLLKKLNLNLRKVDAHLVERIANQYRRLEAVAITSHSHASHTRLKELIVDLAEKNPQLKSIAYRSTYSDLYKLIWFDKEFNQLIKHTGNLESYDFWLKDSQKIALLTKNSKLKSMEWTNSALSDRDLNELLAPFLNHFESFTNKRSCFITRIGLPKLANEARNLQSMKLCDLPVRDEDLQKIFPYLTKVKHITLIACMDVTVENLAALRNCTKELNLLDLSEIEITDAHLHARAPFLPHLECFNLDIKKCENVTGCDLVAIIKETRNLKVFRLNNAGITDAHLQDMAPSLSRLASLIITNCKNIVGEGLVATVKYADRLDFLDLSGTAVTDADLKKMAPYLTKLKSFSAKRCNNITGEGLLAIASHARNLTSIDVSFTNITDRDLQTIAPHIRKLEILSILECKHVTKEGVINHIVTRCSRLERVHGSLRLRSLDEVEKKRMEVTLIRD